jgi:superfamily I DNA/RNA helicase
MDATWWTNPKELDAQQRAVVSIPILSDVLVLGPPGSGKTNLMLLRASFLEGANEKDFVVLVFNRSLKEFLVSGAVHYNFPQERIKSYIQWGREILRENGVTLDDSLGFEEARTAVGKELVAISAKGLSSNKIDFILLDEAQDYSEAELNLLRTLCKRIFAVGDTRQMIYAKPEALTAFRGTMTHTPVLVHHYRNGLKICRLADGIIGQLDSPDGMEATANYDEASNPSTVKCHRGLSLDQQVAMAIDEIRVQLRAYPEHDLIGVMVPKRSDLSLVWKAISKSDIGGNAVLQSSDDGYNSLDGSKRVVVSTIHSAKGLEFRACHILCMDTITKFPTQKKMAYTACTRAKTSLRIYCSGTLPSYLDHGLDALEPKPAEPVLDDLFRTK